MDEIFKRILDTLKGADFWIALAFLAAGYVCWRWIATTTRGKKKVLRRQIGMALLVAVLAGAVISLNHLIFLREPGFAKDLTGVLITRIVGDDALNSLQRDLLGKLNAELQKEKTGQEIEVHASSEIVNENSGLKLAHERARAIGQRLNAKIVIWGLKIGENKFYPRITVVAPLKDWSVARERTYPERITEVRLPEELVDEPFYLLYFAAGYSYFIQDKYEEALPHFEAALTRQGALPNELADLQFFTAFCHQSQSADRVGIAANLQEAIGLYEKAAGGYEEVEQNKWVITQNNLGLLYGILPTGDRAANLLKAIAAFDQAIRVDPEYALAYYNRGDVYRDKGEDDKAIADYDHAIRVEPKFAFAYNNRGNVYQAEGDYDKAIADYDHAIRLDPKLAIAYFCRGSAYRSKKDYDKAIADYDHAIRLDPKYVKVYASRGSAHRSKGDYDKAIADYDHAIRLDPKYAIPLDPELALAYYKRGDLYLDEGDYDKAIADYDHAIRLDPLRLDPKYAFAYYKRGDLYLDKGDYDKAIVDYDHAIRLEPEFAPTYNSYAWLLATCPQATFRNGAKAVEYATKACELSEWKEPSLVDTLAAAYAEAGDFDLAIKWEMKYLETANLSEKKAADAKSRLALYQAHRPYHAEK